MLIELRIVCAAIFISHASSQCSRRSRDCRSRSTPPGDVIFVTDPSRRSGITTTDRPRRRCCPYDFDSKICRTIDDRILCGYNRNPDIPHSKDKIKMLAEGCRIRNGILECGYFTPPYTNFRRPPAWDYPQEIIEDNKVPKRTTEMKPHPTKGCVETPDGRIVCPVNQK